MLSSTARNSISIASAVRCSWLPLVAQLEIRGHAQGDSHCQRVLTTASRAGWCAPNSAVIAEVTSEPTMTKICTLLLTR
jgi:hypothetical protein